MDEAVSKGLQTAGLLEFFNSLPTSHQREYLKWIGEAKKVETKQRRIDKMIEMLRAKQA